MPKGKSEKSGLLVKVTEETVGDTRTVTIEIKGPADMFLFADMLAQRKKIQTCPAYFKTAAMEATKAYLESAEEVISGVNQDQKKDSADAKDRSGKRGRKSPEDRPENGIPPVGLKVKPVNVGPVSAAVTGD